MTMSSTVDRSKTYESAPEHALYVVIVTTRLARHVDQNIDAVRSEACPEAIHDLRINLVKLITILEVRLDRIPAETGSALLEDLRWLKKRSADVRDWDVLLSDRKIWNPSGHGDKALRKLLSLARVSRKRAADNIAAAVRTERCALLQDKLCRLATLGTHSMEGIDSGVQRDLAGMLEHAFKAIRKRAHACETLDPEGLHSLRKSVKRLRYACEVLRESFGGSADTLAFQAYSLQQALGEVHDAEVGRRRIKRLVKSQEKSVRRRAKIQRKVLKLRQRRYERLLEMEWKLFHKIKRFWIPPSRAHAITETRGALLPPN